MERHFEQTFIMLKTGAQVRVVHSSIKNGTVENKWLGSTSEFFTHHENEIWWVLEM